MKRYLLRRLVIAVPSLIGISIVLFTVLAIPAFLRLARVSDPLRAAGNDRH